ncbi:MAG: hypothetical protein A2177_00465 [Spirochaetes bacterium RBG_13_68_11]|nr:MAG: hypothetical protein A2177_00465 [Spirochaetes bacterium RBG_13_68_11]
MAAQKRSLPILVSVSSFVLTLFLFTPARIFIGNFMEFSCLFHESMLFFLVVSLGLMLVLFTVAYGVSRRETTCRTVVSMLTASAFAMWVQGNLFLWPYGVLNGTDIEWDALLYFGFIDAAFWSIVVTFSILKADLVFRFSRLMSLVLIVVQLLSVTWSWISMPKDQSFKQQESSADTLFLFSKHVNVIVLILDTFQSDFFQDIVADDADLRAQFDGFTYFRNALTGSDGTIVSVPNMLTASNYDNTVPYLEFVKNSFLENSLPKTLKEYSFSVDFDPMLKYTVYTDLSGMPSSGRKLKDWDAFYREQALIADLTLFRNVPHFMKESIYNHQRWFFSDLLERRRDAGNTGGASRDGGQGSSESSSLTYARELENLKVFNDRNRDPRFIETFLRSSGVMENTDAFKFYHLKGIHLPLIMNENLDYEEMQPFRINMLRQGTGILKMAATLLERLKQLKVYDNSLIFIVGDHGSGVGDAKINVTPYGNNFNTRGPYKDNFQSFKAIGIPLILVKRMHATGELRTSDAPVSLGDIPQTVAEELGLEASFPGESMFRVEENEDRERIYRAFVGPQEDVEYLAPLYEYAVRGFSWDDTSWRETGNIYYAPK